MQETHTEWFKRVTRNDSNRRAADLANISPVTLGRQLKANELSADLIIKIAQAYNESPVVALVDLGFVSARWIQEVGTTTALTRASDEELTDELLRRLRLLDDQPVDDLASRRAGAPVSDADDSMPLSAVADDSPDEDAMREEQEGDWTDPDNIP
nr:MAG TPA: Transcriptional regulator [Caudoviricetes sp.]